jgi:hypothetical protein
MLKNRLLREPVFLCLLGWVLGAGVAGASIFRPR